MLCCPARCNHQPMQRRLTCQQVRSRHHRSRGQFCPLIRPEVPSPRPQSPPPPPSNHLLSLVCTLGPCKFLLIKSRYTALVRHMTLVNYFPDFLLLLRDVQGQSQTVAQRQADAKSAQIRIGQALDTLRCEHVALLLLQLPSPFPQFSHLTPIKLGVRSDGVGARIQL
jgi:hypothetical protein